ncbi:MAG: hypothetical protein JZU55_10820, partial [Afipia sp.]|nr:hypothetical protein [Afipia sp.]
MDKELESFASGNDVATQAEAFSKLVKLKRMHRAAKEPEFSLGVQKLLNALSEESTKEAERLTASMVLLRIAALVKPWNGQIAKSLKLGLAKQLPALETVADPDDRYYIGTCWRVVNQPWIRAYLAAGAIQEESSERVRIECLEGVVALSTDLADALVELIAPLRRLSFSTEKPGDSKMKRLRRV